MREVVDQAVQDGQDLVPAVEADVDVDAVDDHLPAPPLGAVDELGVALLVRHRLQLRRAERMAAGAEDLDAHGVGDFPDRGQRAAQVRLGFGHGGADAGDELHGVQQQFLLDVRVLVVLVEFGVRGAATPRSTSLATEASSPVSASTSASSHSTPRVDCLDEAKSIFMWSLYCSAVRCRGPVRQRYWQGGWRGQRWSQV